MESYFFWTAVYNVLDVSEFQLQISSGSQHLIALLMY